MTTPAAWTVRDRFLELRSQWMTLIGEHLQTPQGQDLEYWRIQKADSVVVLPIQQSATQLDADGADPSAQTEDRLLLPQPSYRPGVGQITLDFPGGRITDGQSPSEAALVTLQRELGIAPTAITALAPLNTLGWAINSSFSNQHLYGFVAYIQADSRQPAPLGISYPANSEGIHQLLQALTCLQCRAVLLEWWVQNDGDSHSRFSEHP